MDKPVPAGRDIARGVASAALIAAAYAAVTLVLAPISYGPVQLRVSEALCVLPYFTPSAVPGLFIGCLIANILGSGALPDIVFGSLATLIGAAGSYMLRKSRWLVPLPPIVSNALIVPFVLRYAYGVEGAIWLMMLMVGAGEFLSAGILGQILLTFLSRHEREIFNN